MEEDSALTEDYCFISYHTFGKFSNIQVDTSKNPGLKPIGVWEVLKRISGKVVMMISKEDVIKIAGWLQVCAGQEAGVEAAIHNVHDIFKDHITQAVSLLRKKLHKRIQQRW